MTVSLHGLGSGRALAARSDAATTNATPAIISPKANRTTFIAPLSLSVTLDRRRAVALRAEADHAGLAPVSWLRDTVARHVPELVAPDRVVAEIVLELSGSLSTWGRPDVVRQAARRASTSAGWAEGARAWIEGVADAVLEHPSVVALRAPEPPAPVELRRRDGASVFDRHGGTRFTTVFTLEVEQRVIDFAAEGRGVGRSLADPEVVEAAITAKGLGEDQADVVPAVTLDGDTVACVVGPAGTGKSRAMRTAAQGWELSGAPVRGLAVSAVAAGVLAAEADIPADTIAKLVLVGDHAQLGAVEAGGPAEQQVRPYCRSRRQGPAVTAGTPQKPWFRSHLAPCAPKALGIWPTVSGGA